MIGLFELVSAKNTKWNSGDRTLYSKLQSSLKDRYLLEDIEQWFEDLSKNMKNQKFSILMTI